MLTHSVLHTDLISDELRVFLWRLIDAVSLMVLLRRDTHLLIFFLFEAAVIM